MIADVQTVIWKEFKELFAQRTGLRGGVAGLLVLLAVFGIFMPLQTGRAWVESPAVLIYWAWMPLFFVSGVVADSFAGERERHTLETLLASRLSDRAILLGKIGAAVGYGWGLMLASLLLGVVTVNIAHGQGKFLFYPAGTALAIFILGLLAACLAASAGVLISLRAPTARQAQQTLSIAIMLLLFVPIFGIQALPVEWKAYLVRMMLAADLTRVVLIVMTILLTLDTGLFAAAMARFQRARLILD